MTIFLIHDVQFIIGDGNNMYDFTYVENVAHAHVCAERALASGGAVAEKAAGQVTFLIFLFCMFCIFLKSLL